MTNLTTKDGQVQLVHRFPSDNVVVIKITDSGKVEVSTEGPCFLAGPLVGPSSRLEFTVFPDSDLDIRS